jgi:YggT family protein
MTTFIYFLYYLFQVLTFAIFFRAILSWFTMSSRSPLLISIYRVFIQITEPIMAPLRRIIPTIGMVDITPIIAILLLQIIAQVLVRAL